MENFTNCLRFQRYIPGMEGTVRPSEPLTADREQQAEQQREALQRLEVCDEANSTCPVQFDM